MLVLVSVCKRTCHLFDECHLGYPQCERITPAQDGWEEWELKLHAGISSARFRGLRNRKRSSINFPDFEDWKHSCGWCRLPGRFACQTNRSKRDSCTYIPLEAPGGNRTNRLSRGVCLATPKGRPFSWVPASGSSGTGHFLGKGAVRSVVGSRWTSTAFQPPRVFTKE